jgi:hypothetical protein
MRSAHRNVRKLRRELIAIVDEFDGEILLRSHFILVAVLSGTPNGLPSI